MAKNRFISVTGLLLFAAFIMSLEGFAIEIPRCSASREFITSLEFLRQEKAFRIPEPEARKMATEVSKGCTGAAGRFIRITQMLGTAGMGGPEASRMGLTFAKKTDREADTFIAVFNQAFLEENLDLDFQTALRLAKSLSLEFEGDINTVRGDFVALVHYCLSPEKLGLAKPRCAHFAAELARKGQAFNGGIARPFMTTLEFLKSDTGPSLTTEAAIRLASELISHGPEAQENFLLGYHYAISKKGLDLPRNEAIAFARSMAGEIPTISNTKSEMKE